MWIYGFVGLTRIEPRTIRARENFSVHDDLRHSTGGEGVERIKGAMARPQAHYSLIARNHLNGARLKVELIDLPFSENRRFRLRVNGVWARPPSPRLRRGQAKLPVGSKTAVFRQLRTWLVKN